MTGLLIRLGLAGARRRRVAVVLTFLLVTAAAATATLAVQVNRVAGDPWDQTFRATNGAHVIASGDRARLGRVAAAEGVVGSSGTIESVVTTLSASGREVGLRAIGVGVERPAVEHPLVTDGRWLEGPAEIVVERSYAHALGLGPGDRVAVATTTGRRELTVVGIAVRASDEPYPESMPGAGFVTPATLDAIQPDPALRETSVAVRLSDPGAAAEVARAASASGLSAETWQQRKAETDDRSRVTTIVLTTFTITVLVAVALMVATFVGARVLEQRRELALLKAEGVTPRQLIVVGLVENLLVGLAGALVGVGIGILLAPAIVKRSADLVGGVPRSFDPLSVLLVVVAVEALIALVTIVPLRRVGRAATMGVLAGSEAPRRGRLTRLGRPLPLTVGLKQSLSRPGRTAAILIALTLSVASSVAVLGMEATLSNEDRAEAVAAATPLPPDPAGLAPARTDAVTAPDLTREQIRPIVWSLNALLLAVIVANLLATALLSERERVRENGVLRALGLTPRQTVGAAVSALTAIAAVAAVIGVPLGIGLFTGVYRIANGTTDLVAMPPAWQVALVALGTVALVALVAVPPARRAAGRRVVDALAGA